MTDRPILFSAPMVQALLAGRKTQTRRILKQQPHMRPEIEDPLDGPPFWACFNGDQIGYRVNVPYAIGDQLWVKETWACEPDQNDKPPRDLDYTPVYYLADDVTDPYQHILYDKVRPSIFMPKWASRLTLLVTDVRVERLQDISEADAEQEGCPPCPTCHGVGWINSGPDGGWQCTAIGCGDANIDQYARFWNSINGQGAWDENPWVVAVEFKVIDANIDAVAR